MILVVVVMVMEGGDFKHTRDVLRMGFGGGLEKLRPLMMMLLRARVWGNGLSSELLWTLLLMDSAPIKVKRFDKFMMGSGARLWKLWLMGACVMLLAAISVAINLMWGMSFASTFYHTRGAPGIIHTVALSPIVRSNLTCNFLDFYCSL